MPWNSATAKRAAASISMPSTPSLENWQTSGIVSRKNASVVQIGPVWVGMPASANNFFRRFMSGWGRVVICWDVVIRRPVIVDCVSRENGIPGAIERCRDAQPPIIQSVVTPVAISRSAAPARRGASMPKSPTTPTVSSIGCTVRPCAERGSSVIWCAFSKSSPEMRGSLLQGQLYHYLCRRCERRQLE